MKFLIILALFAAIVCALPVEEVGQNQEIEENPLSIVNLEGDSADYDNSEVLRQKRHRGYGGYGGYGGGYGGYGGGYGGYGGGYGGYGGGYGGYGGYGG
ncbi:hypothetical protein ACKWTF_016684 [Chironomus riparius]